MNRLSCLVLVAFAFCSVASGCSNSKKPDAGTGKASSKSTNDASLSDDSSGNPLTAPVDYLGAVNKAKKVGERTVDTAPLTQAMNQFISAEGRMPKDFSELVSEGYLDRVPEAPKGMRYIYDRQRSAIRVVPAQ